MKTRVIEVVINLLNQVDFKELETKTIKAQLALMRKLSNKQKESIELQQKILESYGIEPKNGQYVWTKHPEFENINKKIDQVINDDITKELKGLLNYMSEDEFINSTKKNLQPAQVLFLEEYLVIKP